MEERQATIEPSNSPEFSTKKIPLALQARLIQGGDALKPANTNLPDVTAGSLTDDWQKNQAATLEKLSYATTKAQHDQYAGEMELLKKIGITEAKDINAKLVEEWSQNMVKTFSQETYKNHLDALQAVHFGGIDYSNFSTATAKQIYQRYMVERSGMGQQADKVIIFGKELYLPTNQVNFMNDMFKAHLNDATVTVNILDPKTLIDAAAANKIDFAALENSLPAMRSIALIFSKDAADVIEHNIRGIIALLKNPEERAKFVDLINEKQQVTDQQGKIEETSRQNYLYDHDREPLEWLEQNSSVQTTAVQTTPPPTVTPPPTITPSAAAPPTSVPPTITPSAIIPPSTTPAAATLPISISPPVATPAAAPVIDTPLPTIEQVPTQEQVNQVVTQIINNEATEIRELVSKSPTSTNDVDVILKYYNISPERIKYESRGILNSDESRRLYEEQYRGGKPSTATTQEEIEKTFLEDMINGLGENLIRNHLIENGSSEIKNWIEELYTKADAEQLSLWQKNYFVLEAIRTNSQTKPYVDELVRRLFEVYQVTQAPKQGASEIVIDEARPIDDQIIEQLKKTGSFYIEGKKTREEERYIFHNKHGDQLICKIFYDFLSAFHNVRFTSVMVQHLTKHGTEITPCFDGDTARVTFTIDPHADIDKMSFQFGKDAETNTDVARMTKEMRDPDYDFRQKIIDHLNSKLKGTDLKVKQVTFKIDDGFFAFGVETVKDNTPSQPEPKPAKIQIKIPTSVGLKKEDRLLEYDPDAAHHITNVHVITKAIIDSLQKDLGYDFSSVMSSEIAPGYYAVTSQPDNLQKTALGEFPPIWLEGKILIADFQGNNTWNRQAINNLTELTQWINYLKARGIRPEKHFHLSFVMLKDDSIKYITPSALRKDSSILDKIARGLLRYARPDITPKLTVDQVSFSI